MSDDHLKYDLSKQLRDLGVEFDKGNRLDNYYWTHRAEGDQLVCSLTSFRTCKHDICAPSTAQLIDKISQFDALFKQLEMSEAILTVTANDVIPVDKHINIHNKCCTTALGLALIELVKGEKDAINKN